MVGTTAPRYGGCTLVKHESLREEREGRAQLGKENVVLEWVSYKYSG